jgi:hypothetical protein
MKLLTKKEWVSNLSVLSTEYYTLGNINYDLISESVSIKGRKVVL